MIKYIIWPKFKSIPDLMPVFGTCKFEEDAMKIKGDIPRTRLNMFFYLSRTSNSRINCIKWPKFEQNQNFMPVKETCEFEKISIKTKGALPWTRSNMGFLTLKAE